MQVCSALVESIYGGFVVKQRLCVRVPLLHKTQGFLSAFCRFVVRMLARSFAIMALELMMKTFRLIRGDAHLALSAL